MASSQNDSNINQRFWVAFRRFVVAIADQLRASQFVRRTLVLMGGASTAQVILLLTTPVLTRLYNPEDLGIFGVYVALIATLGVLVTLRYENALLLPKEEKDALAVFMGLIILSFTSSVLILITLIFFGKPILGLLNSSVLYDLKWLIPIGVFLMGIMQGLNSLTIRRARFLGLAQARIGQSASTALVQMSSGFYKSTATGLIFGQILGQCVGLFGMLVALRGLGLPRLKDFDLSDIRRVFVRYRQFPIFSLPADTLNSVASYLPLIIFAKYFGPEAAGLFTLVQRVMLAPIALVGNSVLDVFREHATRDFRNTGTCRPITVKTLLGLFSLALLPTTILFLFGAPIFDLVFGDEWAAAGKMASLMALLMLTRFCASPISYVLYVTEKQHIDLIWQSALLVVTALSLYVGIQSKDIYNCLAIYASASTVMYLIYAAIAIYYSGASLNGRKVCDNDR